MGHGTAGDGGDSRDVIVDKFSAFPAYAEATSLGLRAVAKHEGTLESAAPRQVRLEQFTFASKVRVPINLLRHTSRSAQRGGDGMGPVVPPRGRVAAERAAVGP